MTAGHEAFGVTTWDALNASLAELGGDSRRGVAERKLAESVLRVRSVQRTRRGRRWAVLGSAVEALGATVWIVTQPHWSHLEVEQLNDDVDLEVPQWCWGQSWDGIHPADFDPYTACVDSAMQTAGIL